MFPQTLSGSRNLTMDLRQLKICVSGALISEWNAKLTFSWRGLWSTEQQTNPFCPFCPQPSPCLWYCLTWTVSWTTPHVLWQAWFYNPHKCAVFPVACAPFKKKKGHKIRQPPPLTTTFCVLASLWMVTVIVTNLYNIWVALLNGIAEINLTSNALSLKKKMQLVMEGHRTSNPWCIFLYFFIAYICLDNAV